MTTPPKGRVRRSRLTLAAVCATAAALAAGTMGAVGAPKPDDGTLTPGQVRSLEAGIQVAPKDAALPGTPDAANPYLSLLPDLTRANYAGWHRRLAADARQRVRSKEYREQRATAAQLTPASQLAVVHDEEEPAGTNGSNDTLASAERIGEFGTKAGKNNVLRIVGERADLSPPSSEALPPVPEDNGSIPLAGDTGIEGGAAVTTTGVIGDGPHGSSGSGSGDFDFYTVGVSAGESVVADTVGSPMDTVLVLYDDEGNQVAANDDTEDLTSAISYRSDEAGTYYLAVGGYSFLGTVPADPFDSGSGPGAGDEGDYNLSVAAQETDSDKYAVQLRPGDVIGGVGQQAARSLTVFRPDGEPMVGADGLDASFLYAPESPLPGGGNTTIAYVAEEAGWYVLGIGGDVGAYQVQLEGYRPGAQTDRKRSQTVLLDFEGGRVNTGIWGGAGVRELSPFSAFLSRWGIARDREEAMIRRIRSQVYDSLQTELEGGLNEGLKVRVATTRYQPNLEGRDNVSRVIVGGTIEQSGISTIGIAQYIDPGNYGHEDQSLVLLDALSSDAGPPFSLNTYLAPRSRREAFVAQALGNIIAHEVGHTVGNYHTDNLSEVVNTMDAGGAGFDNLFGVGPDGVGGTADDLDVAFTEDAYIPSEGFTGLEDTLNVTAWAYPGS